MQRRIAMPLLLLSVLACSQPISERARNHDTASLHSDEPALSRAAEKAQATLDDFLTRVKQRPEGIGAYALRVRIQEGRDTEYFWVDEFSWSDGSFTGRINHSPQRLKSVKAGQAVGFSRSQIVDWRYVDEKTGATFGDFTSKGMP
jgi:uncharacterized protein YegJ (DUF2314 family)